MNREKIKQTKKFLHNLQNSFDDKSEYLAKDIIDWVSVCVANFSSLGVNDVIISEFIKFYKPTEETKKYESHKPWATNISFLENKIQRIGNFISVEYSDKYRMDSISYLAEIAFLNAKNILQRMEEELRIVPMWLVNEFSENDAFLSISSSLKLIEANYEDRDSDGIITNTISLLDEILNLDNDLKKKGEIGKKLNALQDDPSKLQKFGISREYVYALNNSRLIRNIKSIHKTRPMKYDIPFLLAVNNAFLIIMFLEIALSAQIIKVE